MPSNYVTRSSVEDETIQKAVERVISSDIFINKIMDIISNKIDVCLANCIKPYEEKISKLQEELNVMTDRLELLEQYSRLDNIRLFGLDEKADENITNEVISLFNTKLQVEVKAEDISICHRLRSKVDGARPVIVKFCRRSIKNNIYRVKSRLKGTKIIMREDLTKQRTIAVSDLNKRFNYKNVFTNNGNIFVKLSNKIHRLTTLNEYKKFIANL